MKKITSLLLAIALLLPALPAQAQSATLASCPYPANVLKSAYKEMLTVSSTALPLTMSVYRPGSGAPNAVCALIVSNANSISWWSNGSIPTAADGIITAASTPISIGVNDMVSFRMIRATASDATVAIQYFVLTQ